MSTCDGTRNIRAVPRRNQRHERHTKTVVTSPLRKSWPRKPNTIYTLEGLALTAYQHALSYVSKKHSPQLWAAIMNDIGRAHFELGIRTVGMALHTHLIAAIQAYRQALEVYT